MLWVINQGYFIFVWVTVWRLAPFIKLILWLLKIAMKPSGSVFYSYSLSMLGLPIFYFFFAINIQLGHVFMISPRYIIYCTFVPLTIVVCQVYIECSLYAESRVFL